MKLKRIISALTLSGMLACTSSCDLQEEYYSETTPDTFITSEANIYSLMSRVLVHWKTYLGSTRWEGQEMTTDEFICPTRSSGDWANGGFFVRLHNHTWRPTDSFSNNNYYESMQGVARCNQVIQQLQSTDYAGLGLTEADRADHIAQMETLKAYFYMRCLDYYGGVPLYNPGDTENKPRATALETFKYCENIFKDACKNLKPKAALGASEEGYLSRAAAATLLAELYFNAEAYIGEAHFNEAATLCQDIISGVYGPYDLDPTWNGIFSFNNDKSPEMIWCCPSEYVHMEFNWYYRNFMPYNIKKYFNNAYVASGYNGYCLAPSLDPAGQPYSVTNPEIKLGSPFAKFHKKDLRKKVYRYKGNGEYVGMFLFGELVNNVTGDVVTGNKEDKGKAINLRDQVYNYVKNPNPTSDTPSKITDACESCGVRLLKFPIPNDNDVEMTWTADFPAVRLAEVYYTLAECKYRAGDKKGACELFNKVRARNFKDGNDPDPCTEANLDFYRIADEWMIEFLGEGRRRTDLIRLGFFITEKWWDHEPSNDKNLLRFPIGDTQLSANPLLKQNPGYGGTELSPEEI